MGLFNLFKNTEKSESMKTFRKDVTVILDGGHGKDTKGKCSPKLEDGTRFYEWEFNREIVRLVAQGLDDAGIKYHILVPEDTDISLTERCRRVNKVYKDTKKRCFLVSVHANAAGNGQWMNARGWSVFTTVGKTKSDDIATIFWNEMKTEFPSQKIRMDTSDSDVDYEKNFTIIHNTNCPAILVENFFYDNREDLRLLMQNSTKIKIANAMVRAIKKTIMNLY